MDVRIEVYRRLARDGNDGEWSVDPVFRSQKLLVPGCRWVMVGGMEISEGNHLKTIVEVVMLQLPKLKAT